MYKSAFYLLAFLLICACDPQARESAVTAENDTNTEDGEFRFAFLTDIHILPERSGAIGFQQAVDTLNTLDVDFVITGGDLVMDALDQTYGRSDSLYALYKEVAAGIKVPVHNTVGNHEVYGWHRDEAGLAEHPEYGKGMFEKHFGPRYHSFDHKGWHFMILDGIQQGEDGHYIGGIDEAQFDWIKEELAAIDPKTPIALSTHIPFITSQTQLSKGSLEGNSASLVLTNGTEVLGAFRNHNLRLVLQGHLHYLEDIYIQNQVHFITGGAVSGYWWQNQPGAAMEEGFLLIGVEGEEIDWEYVDYGWTPPAS